MMFRGMPRLTVLCCQVVGEHVVAGPWRRVTVPGLDGSSSDAALAEHAAHLRHHCGRTATWAAQGCEGASFGLILACPAPCRPLQLLLTQADSPLTNPQATPRPDVLFLASDDMRPELGCYGCSYMHTPAIDALAMESVVFDHMYVQFALCSPSRTAFLTTRRPDTSLVHDQDFFRYSGGNFTTMPQHFKESGYLSLGTGKLYHPVPCQYITPLGIPCAGRLDPAVAFDANFSWSPESLPYEDEMLGTPPGDPVGYEYSSGACHQWDALDDDMTEGKLATHALALLDVVAKERHAASANTRPFFLAVGFHKPHIPWHAPKKYYDLYPRDMPLPIHDHTPVSDFSPFLPKVTPMSSNSTHYTPLLLSFVLFCSITQLPLNCQVGATPYSLTDTWHAEWNKFSDLNQTVAPVSPNMPRDNTTVPLDIQRMVSFAFTRLQ